MHIEVVLQLTPTKHSQVGLMVLARLSNPVIDAYLYVPPGRGRLGVAQRRSTVAASATGHPYLIDEQSLS